MVHICQRASIGCQKSFACPLAVANTIAFTSTWSVATDADNNEANGIRTYNVPPPMVVSRHQIIWWNWPHLSTMLHERRYQWSIDGWVFALHALLAEGPRSIFNTDWYLKKNEFTVIRIAMTFEKKDFHALVVLRSAWKMIILEMCQTYVFQLFERTQWTKTTEQIENWALQL